MPAASKKNASRSSVKKKLAAKSPEVQALEKKVEQLTLTLDRQRRAKFSIPAGPKRGKTGGSYLRVIIPDTHGAHLDKQAASAFLKDLEHLNPAEVVMLGDHLDCGGFLAQHHTLGFVPETDTTFEQDVEAANTFIDAVQKRVPRTAECYYLVGNHEARLEKWVIKQTLTRPADARFLDKMFGLESLLNLTKRGLNVVKRDVRYDGLRKRGTIKLGKCLFQHGRRCGKTAAKAALDDAGTNVCSGHTHRMQSHFKETADGLIGSWMFGCLCELNPLYYDTDTTDWAHGFGIQIVHPNGLFTTLSVPIIDGVSLFRPLVKRVS
jgi:UDP-2,3-diacylglucosamine pyrophosphatase LpxH